MVFILAHEKIIVFLTRIFSLHYEGLLIRRWNDDDKQWESMKASSHAYSCCMLAFSKALAALFVLERTTNTARLGFRKERLEMKVLRRKMQSSSARSYTPGHTYDVEWSLKLQGATSCHKLRSTPPAAAFDFNLVISADG